MVELTLQQINDLLEEYEDYSVSSLFYSQVRAKELLPMFPPIVQQLLIKVEKLATENEQLRKSPDGDA